MPSSLTGSLTAWYRAFDNTDSTGSYDLILRNDASTSSVGDSKCGSYFVFPESGVNPASYLEISTSGLIELNSDDGFTFSTWAYNIETGPEHVFLLKGNSHHYPFVVLSDGNIAFRQDCGGGSYIDSGYDLRSDITPGTWHHLTMVISGDSVAPVTPTAKYYLDGTLVTTITLNPACNPFTMNGGLGIGYINNEETGGGYKKAFERLTDIAFWNRALDVAEIQTLSSGCLGSILNPPLYLRNSFGTVAHTAPYQPIEFRNVFGTVAHTAPYQPIEFRNVFGSVVHTTSSIPELSGKMNLYSNISEIAWIYKDDSPGGGGGGGGSTSSIIPQTYGGPMINSSYIINSFKALSSERVRRIEQVPFRLAGKDRLGIRKIIPSGSSPPTPSGGDDLRVYGNVTEIAWIYKE